MTRSLPTENQMYKRFLVGLFIVNLLAQAIGWGYKYWSGREYRAERRQAEHWQQVYSVVMDNTDCSVYSTPQVTLIDSKPIDQLTVLSCKGHSNLSVEERKAILHRLNSSFELVDKPSKVPDIHIITFDKDKMAMLLPPNTPHTNTFIEHLIDAPSQ